MKSDKMTSDEFQPFTVEILVADFDRSFDFYKNKLGFDLHRLEEPPRFAVFKFHDIYFMVREYPNLIQPAGQGVILRFIIPNLEEYFEKVKSNGVEITKPIEQMNYGLKRFYVEDPDGYQLKFAQ